MIDAALISMGILCSVVGGVILHLMKSLAVYISELRGPYTGKWENRIYNSSGGLVKVDRMSLRQRGEEVKGTIKRISPEKQKCKIWRFQGRIIDQNLFATYWSKQKRIKSYGSWYVRQKADDKFSGVYLKYSNADAKEVDSVEITMTKLPSGFFYRIRCCIGALKELKNPLTIMKAN